MEISGNFLIKYSVEYAADSLCTENQLDTFKLINKRCETVASAY